MPLPRPPLGWFPARYRIRPRVAAHWAVVVGLTTAAILLVTARLDEADDAIHRWGRLRHVVVATDRVEPGEVVGPNQVEERELPATAVPAGALTEAPSGRVATSVILPGEPVVTERLAPDGLSGVTALLPPDTRALAVPGGAQGLALVVGDRVDVLAVLDPLLDGGEEPTRAVAVGATVVDVGDEAVTVAVTPEEAPEVAFALSQGTLTLALSADLGNG